jgi:hypothetical protein
MVQGFFILIVYLYPRIVRWFETGTRLTAPFAESRIISSIHGVSRLRSFGNSRRSTNESSETETVGQVVSQLSRLDSVELSEPSASGTKPSDAKMKKRVSFARTPSLSEMAADAAEDMAKDFLVRRTALLVADFELTGERTGLQRSKMFP